MQLCCVTYSSQLACKEVLDRESTIIGWIHELRHERIENLNWITVLHSALREWRQSVLA